METSGKRIVGSCKTYEKTYFRLTTEPKPSTVRPESVLKEWFPLLLEKEESSTYEYFSSQLKSIRQDLVVQGINNSFTLEVYLENIRASLKNNDNLEFVLCINCTLSLLASRVQKFEKDNDYDSQKEEFHLVNMICYKIFHDISVPSNSMDVLHGTLSHLPTRIRQDKRTRLAVAAYVSAKQGLYSSFFRLYQQLDKGFKKALEVTGALDNVRLEAWKRILVSYMVIESSFVTSELCFPNKEQCHAFLEAHCKRLVLASEGTEIDTRQTRSQR
eukprot:TRINITY_DN6163_c0_g1_i1.p1 TRINITY_DN6163_c0_g1~~TRINITY_DN6163_c0_g1_i1.p1  ORF type:complete len:282 (-),score=30.28 TRINITY_DN6163_c0_g1_i1:84-902(-)